MKIFVEYEHLKIQKNKICFVYMTESRKTIKYNSAKHFDKYITMNN